MSRLAPDDGLLGGLAAAVARFEAATQPSEEAFHALLEVLAWVGCVRDRLLLREEPIPPLLTALYYVRNVVLHQGADVLLWATTAFGEGRFGEGPFGGAAALKWPYLSEMDSPRVETGAREYTEVVANRHASAVFAELATVLGLQR